jgi:hypothetical protein
VSRTTRLLPWLVAPLLAALPALPAGADPWKDPATRVQSTPGPVRAPYPGKDASWDRNEPQRRLAVYGDSLVMQTKPLLEALAGTRATAVDVWELSGAAPCDLLPTYGTRVSAFAAERVQLAFVGNATTGCMTSRIGGRPPGTLTPALRTRIVQVYETDLEAIVRWNRSAGVRTYLALPPAMAAQTWHGQLTVPLTAALRRLAARFPDDVRLNTAPRDALTPDGVYRSSVLLNGRSVQLRHRDGTHLFAPVGTTLNAQALLWPLALED